MRIGSALCNVDFELPGDVVRSGWLSRGGCLDTKSGS